MLHKYSFEESGAFLERFVLEPASSGTLDGLTFAIKDLMDVAGSVTGCGNPTWRNTHPPASAHAVCVEQLLSAGARAVGKTITDELAFSLLGENHFYGTPLNPKAPDRVPGGSSSGSASAVACGLVDFALGTDTGGSVRVPAANCGIWGIRPTHGVVSVAGVNPLSTSFDTVGVLASNFETLKAAASILLSVDVPNDPELREIHILKEAWDLCDTEARDALQQPLVRLRDLFGGRIRETSMREIDEESGTTGLQNWFEIYRIIQRAEAESSLGAWVAFQNPEFGPTIAESFQLTRSLDRRLIAGMIRRREKYYRRMKSFLRPTDLLCLPATPAPAPLKGSITKREQSPGGYYPRALSLTSIAGVTRSPQLSMPLADLNGAPLGFSLMSRTGEDAFLLGVAGRL